MARTLYRIDLSDEWSNKEQKIADRIGRIPGIEIFAVYKFKLMFVSIDDEVPNAVGALKALEAVVRIWPEGGEPEDVSNKNGNGNGS